MRFDKEGFVDVVGLGGFPEIGLILKILN